MTHWEKLDLFENISPDLSFRFPLSPILLLSSSPSSPASSSLYWPRWFPFWESTKYKMSHEALFCLFSHIQSGECKLTHEPKQGRHLVGKVPRCPQSDAETLLGPCTLGSSGLCLLQTHYSVERKSNLKGVRGERRAAYRWSSLPGGHTWPSSIWAPSVSVLPYLLWLVLALRKTQRWKGNRRNLKQKRNVSDTLTWCLLSLVLAEVSHDLARLAAITGVGPGVDMERQHRVSHLHLVAVGQWVRLTLGFGLWTAENKSLSAADEK